MLTERSSGRADRRPRVCRARPCSAGNDSYRQRERKHPTAQDIPEWRKHKVRCRRASRHFGCSCVSNNSQLFNRLTATTSHGSKLTLDGTSLVCRAMGALKAGDQISTVASLSELRSSAPLARGAVD